MAKARVPEELKLFVKAQMSRGKTGSTGGAPPLMLALAESAAKAPKPIRRPIRWWRRR